MNIPIQHGNVQQYSGEKFSQNFSYNFSEFLYNFRTFSQLFLYELEHFSENLYLFSEYFQNMLIIKYR